MNAQKTILFDNSIPVSKVVLFDDEIGLKTPKLPNNKKATDSITEKDNSNTALIIALLGLIVLIGYFIYQNMNDNE
jgi:hypothetical protein